MILATPQLLALAKSQPLQALVVSAGRLARVHRPESDFVAVYIPSPTSHEYTVLLNDAQPLLNREAALRAVVRHHTEEHAPRKIHVFRCNHPKTCVDCISARVPIRKTDDHFHRTMRRLNWG